MRFIRVLGILIAALGAFLIWVLGESYGPCQSMVTAALNQQACVAANSYHFWGIVLLIFGIVVVILTMIGDSRRN
jgi:hypothetical protein